jgi:hypothetical protein
MARARQAKINLDFLMLLKILLIRFPMPPERRNRDQDY